MVLKIALIGQGSKIDRVLQMMKQAKVRQVQKKVHYYDTVERFLELEEIPNVIAIEESLFFDALALLQKQLKQISMEKGRKLIITDVTDGWDESNLDDWVKEFNLIPSTLQIPIPNGVKEVEVNDILYFENINRKVYIQTKTERYQTSMRLKDVAEKTGYFPFKSPYVSYMVHLNQVQEIKQTDLVMKNGDVLPLSQKKASQFRKSFKTHLSSLS